MIELNGVPIEIETARLLLKPVVEADVTEEYIHGLNDPRVNEYLVGVRRSKQTRASVEEFVVCNRNDPDGVLFGLFAKPSRTFIGTVRLHCIEEIHQTATVGVCLFQPDYWSQGFSAEAITAISEWAFAHLPLRYLEASCYSANTASLKTFLKAGFAIAARFEDKYLHNGVPVPVVFVKRVLDKD